MQIIYATDGSEGALAAARLLGRLPLEADCRLTLLIVAPPGEAVESDALLASTRDALGECLANLEVQVRHGSPAVEILEAADEQFPDLLVLGAGGRGAMARFLIGSVADRVARHAACPVLIARPLRNQLQRLVVGIDGSPGAERVVETLQRLPLPDACEIRLVAVLPSLEDLMLTSRWLPLPLLGRQDAEAVLESLRHQAQEALDKQAAALEAAGQHAVIEVRRGEPAMTLIQTAEDEGADLIVTGAQGHDLVERFLMGSVSDKVLRYAPCSVLIGKKSPLSP
jgi:nucleotide-binding universal stress UspA family protein